MEEWVALLEKIERCLVVWWEHKCSSFLYHELISERRGWKIKTFPQYLYEDYGYVEFWEGLSIPTLHRNSGKGSLTKEFWDYLLSKPLLLMLCVSSTPKWSIWISHSTSQFRVIGYVRKWKYKKDINEKIGWVCSHCGRERMSSYQGTLWFNVIW